MNSRYIVRSEFVQKRLSFIVLSDLKVHKIEKFFDSDFGICVISLLVMHK